MTLLLIVALAIGSAVAYIAYKNPRAGVAIGLGIAAVTLLYLIWEKDPSVLQTEPPGPVPTSTTPLPVAPAPPAPGPDGTVAPSPTESSASTG